MSHAIHSMTVERGVDPRAFTLLAYGGGGGLFAAATAEELEIPRIVVPRAPGDLLRLGDRSRSDYREDASLTRVRSLEERAPTARSSATSSRSRGRVERELTVLRVRPGRRPASSSALDLRFEGQEHTVGVPIDEAWLADDAAFARRCRASGSSRCTASSTGTATPTARSRS